MMCIFVLLEDASVGSRLLSAGVTSSHVYYYFHFYRGTLEKSFRCHIQRCNTIGMRAKERKGRRNIYFCRRLHYSVLSWKRMCNNNKTVLWPHTQTNARQLTSEIMIIVRIAILLRADRQLRLERWK